MLCGIATVGTLGAAFALTGFSATGSAALSSLLTLANRYLLQQGRSLGYKSGAVFLLYLTPKRVLQVVPL